MGSGQDGMAPKRCRRSIGASIMFGFGLPQLGKGLLLSNMLPRSSPGPTLVSRSPRYCLHRSFRDKQPRMSAISPPVLKQQEGDEDALRPGGDTVDAVAPAAASVLEGKGGKSSSLPLPRHRGEGDTGTATSGTLEARRSKWPWRRRTGVEEGKRGQEEERGNLEEEEEDSQQAERGNRFTYDWDNGERVVWRASKKSRAQVEEGSRKLSDYLALPPTEYSLLDPKMITRLSDETFRMDGATINILGTQIKPILFVKVEVQPEHSQANIMVERVELDGSEAVRSAAGSFNVTSSTIVSCTEMEGNTKAMELSTASDIEIEILVPNENFVPAGVLRRAGNFVMQRVVDIGVPQFTKFLKRDYGRWAEGDDSRAAVVSEGEALIAPEDG